jgi:hypothetical protein
MGGQPLRAGLRISHVGGSTYNFSQSEPHNPHIEGIANVVFGPNSTASIKFTSGVSAGATGEASVWPGLSPSLGCTRIDWGHATWGKTPAVPETRFQVSSQMFGVSTIETADGEALYMYTGERYQTGPDGLFAHGFMYWQPLKFDERGVTQPLNWTDSFVIEGL